MAARQAAQLIGSCNPMQGSQDTFDEWTHFIERLPVPAYVTGIGPAGSTRFASHQIAKLLDYPPSDLIENPDLWIDRIHEEDRQRVSRSISHCKETSSGFSSEYRLLTRGGDIKWVSDNAVVIAGQAGNADCLLGILVDITDSRRIQRELEESESKYRLMVEKSSDLVVKVDTDGRFLFVSPSYCRLFGKTEAELVGRKFMPLVHEEDRESTAEEMRKLYQPPHSVQIEQRAMTRLGWRWLAWTDNAIVDEQGVINTIVGVGRDITDNKRIEKALKESRSLLQKANAYANLGYWELAREDSKALWSEQIYQIFGIEENLNAGPDTLQQLVHPDDCASVMASLVRSFEQGSEHLIDYRICRPDGEERWVECRARPVYGSGGEVEKLSGFLQDITRRKRNEQALRRSEERFRIVATSTTDYIYEWDMQDDGMVWYGDIDRALGYAQGAFPRTRDALIAAVHPDDRWILKQEAERIRQHGGAMEIEYRIAAADGDWRIWRDSAHTVTDSPGLEGSVIGGCADVTRQRMAEERVHHLAFHDALTGLPNRLLFKEELQRTLESFRRDHIQFALHYLDLDHFKDVNDSLGHQVGDELLCEVVTRISSEIRRSDVFARLGGDEFGLIQLNIDDASKASILASKIINRVSEVFQLQSKSIRINTSIGIIVPEKDDISVDELLSRADTALYKAKDAGRGTYAFFLDSMTIQLQREMELVHYLSHAIEREEFFLEYQPQYALADRRLTGLEALIRWNHPHRSLLMPVEFLPIAEKRGLIREISHWALVAACRQARQWREMNHGFGRVAVNLCTMQVNADDFYQTTVKVLEQTGLPAELLELEFTETVLMKATDNTKRSIRALSELGVSFAIDDFGTGFSSLSYLRNFHADKIKIDREFIQDVHADPNDAEIVKATLALGKALGLQTIAEGVENKRQETLLRELGCDQAQGFLYGRPMPVHGIEDLFDQQNTIQ